MYPKKEDPLDILLQAMCGVDSSSLITAQEARGQQLLVNSTVLPKRSKKAVEKLKELGVVFGEEVDGLFVNVTLPAGWKKVATDHSMWSNLVDQDGKVVASIFYKAAFYDHDAFMSV